MGILDTFKKDKKEEEKKEAEEASADDKKQKKTKKKKKKDKNKKVPEGNVLKRPLISEKSRNLTADNKYVFIVEKNANKSEIKKEVENRWNVSVESVNTMNNKKKTRKVTRRGGGSAITGSKGSIKKAIVTLAEGDSIDIFSV